MAATGYWLLAFLACGVWLVSVEALRWHGSTRCHTRANVFQVHAAKFDPNKVPPTSIVPSPFTGTGCVLLVQPSERDHFLNEAAVLITEYNERGAVGVILDKPSAFNVGETSPNMEVFKANTLFLGGDNGGDLAVMIHKYNFDGLTKSLGYGLFLGGLREAREALDRREAHPKDFKFIFNNIQWPPGVLEKELKEGRWDVCLVPPELVLQQNDKSHYRLWSQARNALSQKNALLVQRSVEEIESEKMREEDDRSNNDVQMI